MTATEHMIWCIITSFQFDSNPPWVGISRIAEELGKSYRTVERYIRRMEFSGLLVVIRGEKNKYGNSTNKYDFCPLYEKILNLQVKLLGAVSTQTPDTSAATINSSMRPPINLPPTTPAATRHSPMQS